MWLDLSSQEDEAALLILQLHFSADDEDSGPLLPHGRQTLYHYVLHQAIFILLVLPCLVFLCLPSGWCLPRQPLLVHRVRQLIGQLLHCHLEEMNRFVIITCRLIIVQQQLNIRWRQVDGSDRQTCISLKRWSIATPTTTTMKAPTVVTTSTVAMLLHSWKRMMEVDSTTEVKST